jgi:hypothetical protein
MKLSTEEIKQKLNSIKLCFMAHPDNEPHSEFEDRISTLDEIIDSLTPIEIPSDEDVKQHLTNKHSKALSPPSLYYKIGFKAGAKWIKEQILNQNK